ncbi:hypothetical protein [Paenibacillus guangzhouensis]|uniref:hypothetical protein n=1 Tax=Paenibacillus guangzhouensis TaxID=1473112 RepID=UPI001266CB96|nr:hypothetical protein [Paenibacillus guangzhouensis]
MKYFQEHVQNDKMMNPLLEYLTWLDDTYGRTEWRKNVEMVDGVLRGFAEGLITETVNGIVGTLEFAFNFVVDPAKTTKEVVDTVSYLADNPEVLVEAAKKMYTDFETATPEQRAEMIGAVASMLVPEVSVTKIGKVEKVTEAMTSIAKKMKKIDYPTSVSRLQESFSNMLPYRLAMTPEGVMMMVPNTKKIDFRASKPSSLHDGPNVSKIDGKGDPGKSGIEGTGYTGGRNQKELDDLAGDPSHAGRIEEQGIKERKVGLDLESQGKLGRIIRDPQKDKGAEFIDTTTGTKWDVKSFESYPNGHTSPKKGAFTVEKSMNKIYTEFDRGHNVVIDTRELISDHVAQLKKAIEEAGISDRIIWYPD